MEDRIVKNRREGEFSPPPVKDPDRGDPLGPPDQRWPDVVAGRRLNVELGYD